MTIEELAAELEAAEGIPGPWRAAFLAVPRHRFLSPQFWVDDEQGRPQPVSRDQDPDGWLTPAYSDIPILTQFDDRDTQWPDTNGELCTSSVSQPDLVLRMLTALDIHEGQRVPEIGTGSGYHGALLATRVLARSTVHDDGTATGRPIGQVGFMAVRAPHPLARYDSSPGPRQIRQHGPRHLWDQGEGW